MPLAAFPKCYLGALLVERTMTVETWIDLAAEHLDVDGLELYSRLIADRSGGSSRPCARTSSRAGSRCR